MRASAPAIERDGDGAWRGARRRHRRPAEPDDVLDLGNSGTGARLLMGVGRDAPLHQLLHRRRLAAPPADGARDRAAVAQMGARFVARDGGAPAARRDRRRGAAADHLSPAGALGAGEIGGAARRPQRAGRDHVIEPLADARPHREPAAPFRRRRSRSTTTTTAAGASRVTGQPELDAADLVVPGDPSSAAFPAVAALLRAGLGDRRSPASASIRCAPGSSRRSRDGRRHRLRRTRRIEGGEPVADLVVRAGALKGVDGAGRARAAA